MHFKYIKVGSKVFQHVFGSSYSCLRILKEKRHTSSHKHGPRKLASRHEPRKHGVKDSKVTKIPGGLRNSSPYKSSEQTERTKEPHLLTPSYIRKEPKPHSGANIEETKPQVAKDKPQDQSQSVAATARVERYDELSPLMTTMVEDELKSIMIKIWQTLPDDASTEDEKLVVDKLKNAAGDDLRNTLGLNITKRLLNVHSGILVKASITSCVTSSEVLAFAKKYRIDKFKNLTKRTYAGRMASWTDLDELYTHTNPRCGNAFVKVAPVYNFMKCPLNLRTVFDGKQDYSHVKKLEKEAAKKGKTEGKTVVTADKVLAQEARNKDKVPDTKKVDVKIETIKAEPKNDNSSKDKITDTKKVELKPESRKPEPKQDNNSKNKIADHNKLELKPEPKKLEPKQDNSSNKVADAKKVELKAECKKNDLKKENSSNDKIMDNKVKDKIESNKVEPSKPFDKVVTEPAKNLVEANTNEKAVNKKNTAVGKQSETAKKEDINTSKINQTKPENKITNVDTVKVVDNKLANETRKKETKTEFQTTKVLTAKEVLDKSSVTTNTPTKGDVARKLSNEKPDVKITKVEQTKAPVKTPTKPVANIPTTTINSANKETTTPKFVETSKTVPTINSANKETTTSKFVETSKTVPNKKQATISTPNKRVVKPKPAEIKKPDTRSTKVLPKTSVKESPKALVKSSKNTQVDARAKKNENDFDELNDHDILALLSGGIILDECSGSDED